MIPVRYVPDVLGDLQALPSEQLRRVALLWMQRLRREPHLGPRLQWRTGQDLSRCRKLYFDEGDRPSRINDPIVPRDGGPRFRIVYMLRPVPERPEYVLVLAVGPKYSTGPGVYDEAAGRLD